MVSLAALEPMVKQAEQEVASLAEAVASLYDTPALTAQAQQELERRRSDLDRRLAHARARATELHLVKIEHDHGEIQKALQAAAQHLIDTEADLLRLQRRLAAARIRYSDLEARDRILRERRRELMRKLEAPQP